jgi:hypothetical protein
VAALVKQAPDGTAQLAELQYLLRYGGMKEACRSHVPAKEPFGIWASLTWKLPSVGVAGVRR